MHDFSNFDTLELNVYDGDDDDGHDVDVNDEGVQNDIDDGGGDNDGDGDNVGDNDGGGDIDGGGDNYGDDEDCCRF